MRYKGRSNNRKRDKNPDNKEIIKERATPRTQ